MKISTEGASRYMRQQDVPAPIIATMDFVATVSTLRNPDVLHFAEPHVKPLPLNLLNRRALVAAFGDDSAAWKGRQIELYIDPAVTDSKGQRTGGIRVRTPPAPARSGAAPAAAPRSGTAQRPTPTPQLTLEQKHAQALAGFAGAPTLAKLDEWAAWAKKLGFGDRQTETLADAYQRRKEQLARRSTMAHA